MPSFGPLTQHDALCLTAKQKQFVPLGSSMTQTNRVLSVFVDGRGFFCRMARFLDVPGRRKVGVIKLCDVRGM